MSATEQSLKAADAIVDFAAFCVTTSPTIAARDTLPHERTALLGKISQIDAWLSGFMVAISDAPEAVPR